MQDKTKKPTGKIVFRFCGGTCVRHRARGNASQAEKESQSIWSMTWNETPIQRATALLAPNKGDKRSPLTIQLADGSSLDINPDEWPTLAKPRGASLDLSPHTTKHLFVGKYDDGGTLVYAVIEEPSTDKIIAGELLPAGSAEIEAALWRLTERLEIATTVADRCLDSLKRSSYLA